MQLLPEIRLFDPERDYPTVAGWWAAHGWPAVPEDILPKLGVVAYFGSGEHERGAGAAWLYMDNSVGVCWLEWIVTNPKNRASESMRAIKALTDFLKSQASSFGYGRMMTTCRQPSLVRLHEHNGFIKTDENVTHLIAAL